MLLDQTSGRNSLIEKHLADVPKLVRRLAYTMPRGMTREELACAGYLGLVKGAARADSRRTKPELTAYLQATISGAMRDEIRGITGRRDKAKPDRTQTTPELIAAFEARLNAPSDPPWVLRDALDRAMNRRLNRREASVVTQQYCEDRPLREIAAFWACSPDVIGHVSDRAKAKLRADEELSSAFKRLSSRWRPAQPELARGRRV